MSKDIHKFHIPVLGLGFSADSPIKVAKFGISSVISITDDVILERLREFYSKKLKIDFTPIKNDENDSRSKRIKEYLNLVNKIVKDQFESLKNSKFTEGSDLNKYFELLPDFSELKQKYNQMISSNDYSIKESLQKWLKENLRIGSIDVNIMTKLDKPNFSKTGELLPTEFNDAHSALRGYAESDLESSVVFSAGMNPRLFSYMENFSDFLPNAVGEIKKKIIIKVSDFRSALIQGKFLAKKGLWVSEFRIESGLNCGGHAFATDGYLLGPILEEFKQKKVELVESIKSIFEQTFKNKNLSTDLEKLDSKITVQGGVGTSKEQEFLYRNYKVDSVGWGSPFLLVPEVTNVDKETLTLLQNAEEKDYFLSKASPLGVPFNNIRNSLKRQENIKLQEAGKLGSPCTKKFLTFNKEFSEKPICTASIAYIKKKDSALSSSGEQDSKSRQLKNELIEKECLCEGLSASALKVIDLVDSKISSAVSICPGPNLAYFSKIASMNELIDHIYGRINLITNNDRPNMFIKELQIYITYLQDKIDDALTENTKQFQNYVEKFKSNIENGIEYYQSLIPTIMEESETVKNKMLNDLKKAEERLSEMFLEFA